MIDHPAPCQLHESPACRDEDRIIVVEMTNRSSPTGSDLWFSCANCIARMLWKYPGLIRDLEVQYIW